MDLASARRASGAVRITESGRRARRAVADDRRERSLAQRRRRGEARRRSRSDVACFSSGSATTPLTPRRPAPTSRRSPPRRRDRSRRSTRLHRRQRAEPQPLLAAAVRARRHRRRRAGVRGPARDDLRRAEGGVPPTSRCSAARLAARQRQPGPTRQTHSPTVFIQRPRRRLPRERAHDADHGRVRDPSLRGQLERRAAARPHPNSTTIALADYAKLVALLGTAFDGTAQPGSTLPIVYGEFGVEIADPGGEGGRSTPARSRRRRSRSTRRRRRAYYREAIAARVLPAEREAHASSSTSSTSRRSRRGSPASTTPTARRRRACRGARRRSRPVATGGVVARCPGLRLAAAAPPSYQHGAALTLRCDLDCTVRRCSSAAAAARNAARARSARHAPIGGRADGG